MDETSLDTKGLSPLIDIVNQVQHILHGTTSSSRERPDLGSSQAKHTTEQDNTSLTEAVKLLMNQGVDSLITFRTKASVGVPFCSHYSILTTTRSMMKIRVLIRY